ncbi:hypothetical protein [Erythrobacter alti]|uniref:energy transducer TonB family protein n=1 Tax=Erythrobacter alti TaxID=1896145 RepID=UPI0030F3C446
MKTLRIATIALVSAGITLSLPLAAQDQDPDEQSILVQPTSEEARYAAHVSQQLDDVLARYSFGIRRQDVGFVRVQFITNGAGVAEDLTLIGDSGSNRLDRAALWAISRLSDISPPHIANSDRQVIQANIVFAARGRQAERIFRQLERAESARIALARERGEPPVLALNLGAAVNAR